MIEIKPKRRWFSFSLRTLLVGVTLAAVGLWAYFVGWPWWKDYHERQIFRQFKQGMSVNELTQIVTSKCREWDFTERRDTGSLYFDLGEATYVAFLQLRSHGPKHGDSICQRIEVFRLPPAQISYKATSENGTLFEKDKRLFAATPYRGLRMAYMADFFDFISGDRKANPGFQYELIYSDPPVKSTQ